MMDAPNYTVTFIASDDDEAKDMAEKLYEYLTRPYGAPALWDLAEDRRVEWTHPRFQRSQA